MSRRHILEFLSGLAALVAVAGLWYVFAPAQLGGRVDYAVIAGSSMEPSLHRGDLAVLRTSKAYHVGDVVGYRSGDLHRVVLHRIIGVVGGHYVFKGDNNDFVDSFRPTQGQLVGKLWLHVPAVGRASGWLHAPQHAGLIGGLIALLLAGGAGAETRRRRRGRGDGAPEREQRPPRRRVADGGTWIAAGIVLCVAAAAFGALYVLALGQGTTRVVSDSQGYVEKGAYSYSGAARPGAVYPSGRVSTGDTVFTRLVHHLHLGFAYRFSSSYPHGIAGTVALKATLKSQQGLTRVLPLGSPGRISADRGSAGGTIDLALLQKTVAAYEKSTGVQADTYTVTVTPTVSLRGTVAGKPLSTVFSPTPLSLGLDVTKLKVLVPEQLGGDGTVAPPDPLHVSAAGPVERVEPASVSLPGLHLSVPGARRLGLIGAVCCVLGALLAVLLAFRGEARAGVEATAEQILKRYGEWIVPVTSPLESARVIDVATIDHLAKLAEHYARAILHEESDGRHTFAVEEEGIMYRFRIGHDRPVLSSVAPVPLGDPPRAHLGGRR